MDDFLVTIRDHDEQLIGNGFFIDNRIILTAGHVLSEFTISQELTVHSPHASKAIEVIVISIFNEPSNGLHLDYGLLQVKDPKFVAPGVAVLAAEKASKDERVTINGYANGSTGQGFFTNGGKIIGLDFPCISDRETWVYSIKTEFQVRACHSGSPIIRLNDNRVIAIQSKITSGTNQKTPTQMRAVGSPISRIKDHNYEVNQIITARQNLNSKARRVSSSTAKRIAAPKIRIVLLLYPRSAVGSFEFQLTTIVNRKLNDAKLILQEVVLDPNIKWLAKEKFIVCWDLQSRVVGPDPDLGDFIGENARFSVAAESMSLIRVVVDSGTSLVFQEWENLDLPHELISHGLIVQVDHEKETLRINDSVISIPNSDAEAVATELCCRILDHFLDINLFYRFGELADLFNGTERKKTFDIVKQDYIAKKAQQSTVYSPASIATLTRKRWCVEPPDLLKLHREWEQFHDYLKNHLPTGNDRIPTEVDEVDKVVKRTFDVIQTRKGLKGRISHTSLKKKLLRDLKGLDLKRPLLLGIITKTPVTYLECETLKAMFDLQEWKTQGKAMKFSPLESMSKYDGLTRWVTVLTINPN